MFISEPTTHFQDAIREIANNCPSMENSPTKALAWLEETSEMLACIYYTRSFDDIQRDLHTRAADIQDFELEH